MTGHVYIYPFFLSEFIMDCAFIYTANCVCTLLISVLGVIEPGSDKDFVVCLHHVFILTVFRFEINLLKLNHGS